MNPQELLYTPTHEWLAVETNNEGKQIGTVGLTSFAVEALTDLVFIQLPEVGQEVTAGEPFGEIESVKAVSDLYSPVTGKVIDVNTEAANNLDLVSQDPFGKGWLIKVEITDPSSLEKLMNYEAYQKKCGEESNQH